MAVTFVSATTDTSDFASSLSFSHTTPSGSDRLLVVAISTRNGPIVSVSYGGQALSSAVSTFSGPGGAALYYLTNPPLGTADVDVVLTLTTDGSAVSAISLSGVLTSDPIDNTGTSTGSTSITNTITSQSNGLVIDVVMGPDNGSGDTPTIGADQISINEQLVSSTRTLCSYEAGAASVTMSWTTLRNEAWRQAVLAINPQPPRIRGAARPVVAPNRRVML